MAVNPPGSEDLAFKGYDPQVTRRLLGFMRPYWKPFAVAMGMMLISTLAVVIGPYLVKVAIDSGLTAGSKAVLTKTVLLYLVVALVQWLSVYLRVRIMARLGQSIIFDLRNTLFEHLQQLSIGFYSRYSVGRVIVRVINDVSVLREFITWAILAVARDLFALVGIVIAMVSMNLQLSC
jgi:ABC-type bacteriocin/lantibiotic exporter with double-glycine peptidase domain